MIIQPFVKRKGIGRLLIAQAVFSDQKIKMGAKRAVAHHFLIPPWIFRVNGSKRCKVGQISAEGKAHTAFRLGGNSVKSAVPALQALQNAGKRAVIQPDAPRLLHHDPVLLRKVKITLHHRVINRVARKTAVLRAPKILAAPTPALRSDAKREFPPAEIQPDKALRHLP